jgi:hypothetical protein
MPVHLLLAVAVAASTFAQQSSKVEDDFNRLTADELQAGIEKRHPAAYYVLAGKLFSGGRQDEAVFWFYAGQLRYRFHLSANPGLPPSGDPALFASLSQVIGQPLNEYAFGDLEQLTATIDKVLAWDERTDNGFTSKATHAAALTDVRGGLIRCASTSRPTAMRFARSVSRTGCPIASHSRYVRGAQRTSCFRR